MRNNRKGEGYILPCVLILVVCMILSVFVSFALSVNVIRMSKRNTRVVLDSFVMQNSILIYDSIKNGNDFTEYLDEDEYIDALCEFCTLDKRGEYLYAYDNDGNENYRISVPEIGYNYDNTLKIYTSYTIFVPVYFAGVRVETVEVPLTIDSEFSDKF